MATIHNLSLRHRVEKERKERKRKEQMKRFKKGLQEKRVHAYSFPFKIITITAK